MANLTHLTDEDLNQIRTDYKNGIMHKTKLQKKYRVSFSRIEEILKDVVQVKKPKKQPSVKINQVQFNAVMKEDDGRQKSIESKKYWNSYRVNDWIRVLEVITKKESEFYEGLIITKNDRFIAIRDHKTKRIVTINYHEFATGDMKIKHII